ncbi:MAG: S8 family serine peptidase [Wenzhouxiangellaceae bacterium]|nr:S8 family serine peptidase [Wenzhouxiangellaceae bacterium]
MRYLTPVFCLAVLAMVLALPAQADPQARRFSDRWIVELVDPPTLEFTGTNLAVQAVGTPERTFFEATAPAVTGPGRFDVEAPHVRAYHAFLQDRQADFLIAARHELGRDLLLEGAFQHVANGVVLTLTRAEAERLQELPGVHSVQRERLYHLELASGPRLIGARALNDGGNQLPGVNGEGIVVGVIDSGINWNHRAFSANPADTAGFVFQNPLGAQLGLCSRVDVPCNNKLIGVFDFTDDSSDGLDTDGHGTHVAAIAVANEWAPGQAGVAPRANLISYRVCVDQDPDDPDAGTCQGAAIVQALDQAIRDRVDVVNFSIGTGPSDPWSSSIARQVLNLRAAGITFVTSGGNSGPAPNTVGWPAEAPWVLAVGASTTDSCAEGQIQVQNLGSRMVTYGTGPNTLGPDLTNEPVRRGGAFDGNMLGCQAFPAGVFDNAVALLERGECTFETKVNNAAAAGARAVLVFNNQSDGRLCMAGLESTTIPSAFLSRSDGLELNGLVNSGTSERVTFVRDKLADQVAGFSSRGPSENVPGVMKPNVIAPGAGIQAAFVPGPEAVAGLTGTSMASPHVAGAIALLRQLNPDWTPAMMSSVLETTAEAAPVSVGGDPADIFDRGAGRIRVDLAARAGLYLGESRAGFLAANPAIGGDPRRLNLPGLVNEDCGSSCTFSRTVTALRTGSWTVSGEGQIGVSVRPSSFSLQAGESQTLQISVTPAGNVGTALQDGAVVLTPLNPGSPVPGQAPLVPQRLPVGVRNSAGTGSVAGTADEPTGRASLNVDAAESCPGFFVLRTHAGEASEPGRFGAEILLTGTARRTLQGGLNFGARATSAIRGFSAFSIANRADEDQIVEITLEAEAAGRLTLERRAGGEVASFIDQAVRSGQTQISVTVPPGFYVVGFEPDQSAPVTYSVAALTRFTDRAGGGFQGGVVFGGYHDPTRENTGFAGFCIAEAQDVEIAVLSSPTYGASAARRIEFSLTGRDGVVIVDSRN